jgi:TolB-like protein
VLSEFLQELQRRRVVRVALAYLVVGWLVIQVSATTFPILDLPLWSLRLVLALVVLGFPVALALSWAFDLTDGGIERTTWRPIPPVEAARTYVRLGWPGRPPFHSGRTRYLVAGTLLLVVALSITGWFAMAGSEARGDALDESLIAVAPFRVSGADPSLGYLREGMVDLLAVKLSGSRQALDPRTSLAAFRGEGDPTLAAARDVAARLRAGALLLGSVVGTSEHITLSASLVRTRDGREVRAQPVTGPMDSLPALVDRLVASVISLEAGESERRLELLTSTSLPALREYLAGSALFRRGQYAQALQHYAAAVELDSTFALAAMALPTAASMILAPPPLVVERAVELVRRYEYRLNPADRAFAAALWPAEPYGTIAERVQMWERLAQEQPHRPEVWYELGDLLFHSGWGLDMDDPLPRARAAFERALALDPKHFVSEQHIVWAAHLQGDTAWAAAAMELYLLREPDGESAQEYRRRLAEIRSDTVAMRAFEEALDTMSANLLMGEIFMNQVFPHAWKGLRPSLRAADVLSRRAASEAERAAMLRLRYELLMNMGQVAEAGAVLQTLAPPGEPADWRDQRRIYDAVYWDGDADAAASAERRLAAQLEMSAGGLAGDDEASRICAVQTWRLWNGSTEGATRAIARISARPAAGAAAAGEPVWRAVCSATLDALLHHQTHSPDAGARLLALDELMRTAPLADVHRAHGNLTLARLWPERDETERGLRAARRLFVNPGVQYYRTTFLELEIRHAAALGRHEEALQAFGYYVAMRRDAQGTARQRLEAVRRVIAGLTEK